MSSGQEKPSAFLRGVHTHGFFCSWWSLISICGRQLCLQTTVAESATEASYVWQQKQTWVLTVWGLKGHVHPTITFSLAFWKRFIQILEIVWWFYELQLKEYSQFSNEEYCSCTVQLFLDSFSKTGEQLLIFTSETSRFSKMIVFSQSYYWSVAHEPTSTCFLFVQYLTAFGRLSPIFFSLCCLYLFYFILYFQKHVLFLH